ncbi:unnamed protein product [Bathycoccus prasinos]
MLSRRDIIIFCANRSRSNSSIILRRNVSRASGESNEDNTNKRRRQRRRPIIEEMCDYFTKPVKCKECFGYNRRVCARCQGRGKTTTTFTDGDDDDNCCGGCVGRGYVRCDACNGTGLKNGWLFTVKGGWGPRGE